MSISVLTIANQKGGVGKTNTVVQLAVQMELLGYGPVVLMDADAPQGSLSAWFNQREAETPLMAELPANGSLKEKIAQLDAAGAKLLIIDTGPRDPREATFIGEAIQSADLVLIPTKVGWRDAQAAVPTIQYCKDYGKNFAFVLNEVKPNMSLNSQTVALLSAYGTVAPSFIGSRASFVNADASSLAAVEIEARGRAAADINSLIEFVVKKLPAFSKPAKEKKRV